jgi:hypothetical protein
MTAPQPETPVAAKEERIGKYRVHPVAAMFPLLEGQDYEDFRLSIEVKGQLKPIVVLGDILLDGRNRLRACLDLGIEPRVTEYTGELDPVDYIEISNIDRRHLGEDARTAICTQIHWWRMAQQGAEKKAAQGHHGTEGGRGRRKTLTTDSSKGLAEPKTRARDARSTVGQIAAGAKVSHHKAAQAVAVAKAKPELLEQVKRGEMPLREAAHAVSAAKVHDVQSPRPASQRQPATGKRKQILQNAAKQRMIYILSYMRGLCRGLPQLDVDMATATMTPEEINAFVDIAHEIAKQACAFERRLKAVRRWLPPAALPAADAATGAPA